MYECEFRTPLFLVFTYEFFYFFSLNPFFAYDTDFWELSRLTQRVILVTQTIWSPPVISSLALSLLQNMEPSKGLWSRN